MERYRSHLVWEAWTDIGSVGVGRTACLGKSDKISQVSAQPRVDPTGGRGGPAKWRAHWWHPAAPRDVIRNSIAKYPSW